MLEIKRANQADAQAAFDIRLYVGHDEAIYHSPSGLQLACIPMVKRLS
ncbi:hypothetical protein J2Y83_002112 [Pseudomonas marginalis]|nr:hypothetical protein [Pseudomonas marginalis]MCP1523643.1 hypothetical protein [Pseudomonas marginalis]MDQ0502600.1 hypothetical protein [Pseudomonas marginalis]